MNRKFYKGIEVTISHSSVSFIDRMRAPEQGGAIKIPVLPKSINRSKEKRRKCARGFYIMRVEGS